MTLTKLSPFCKSQFCVILWGFMFFIAMGILSLFPTACSKNDTLTVQTLQPASTLQVLSDSTYLSSVFSIDYSSGSYFLNDISNRRLLRLDENLNLINTIGKSGLGPGEFVSPVQFAVWKDTVYSFGGSNRYALQVFTSDGDFIRSFSTPIWTMHRFSISNNRVFLASNTRPAPIMVANLSGDSLNAFGRRIAEERERIDRNARHIGIDSEGNIISTLVSEPFIEKYSPEGELIELFDLTSVTELNNVWSRVAEQKSKLKQGPAAPVSVIIMLFPDAYVKDDHLYLLYSSGEDSSSEANVLVIHIEEHFRPVTLLRLQGDSPETQMSGRALCVSDDRLLLYNQFNGTLYQYRLSEI